MKTLLVNADGLTKKYKEVNAVSGIDFTVKTGEMLALLGPNGAGKSTTIEMMLGLIDPTSGTLTVGGLRPHQAASYGVVSAMLQNGAMLDDNKVGSMLRLIAVLNNATERLDDLIDQHGIRDLMDRKVRALSGGQRQMVRLVMALLPDPKLLILDEPTAGLDPTARTLFWQSMRRQSEEHGRTIIFATHYLEEAEQFAQRTIIMNKGHIVADGATAAIRNEVAHQCVTALVPPARHAEIQQLITKLAPDATIDINDNLFTITAKNLRELAAQLMTDPQISGVELKNASLNDTFAALTERI